MSYTAEYSHSMAKPEKFWKEKANALHWFKSPDNILSQDEHGIHHWFADGEMNTAYLALDFHVENGSAEQTALIYDSPVTATKRSYSYRQLRDEVALCAGMLADLGVEKGDRVIIYLPMIPEAVIAMLACFREALVVSRLPKTRSGKILRNTLRKIANKQEYAVPSTIDDPSSLQDIEEILRNRPYN